MPIQKITSGIIEDGAVSAADIVSVSNTAITGLITASQIANVANTQLTGTITGSQISSNTLSNTVFQTGSVENYMNSQNLGFGMRNRIINGAMVVAQRTTSAVTANDSYAVDRWNIGNSTDGSFSAIQDSDTPAGFNKSVKFTITTADASVTGTQSLFMVQVIEGFNIADLNWGTANAKTVTLSFQVKSSVTGTFSGSLVNNALDRSYPFTYTIASANTWTSISVTVAGDTSGTWLTDNGVGIRVYFSLGTGSTRLGTAGAWGVSRFQGATGETALVNTLNATWFITGVQLEKGSTATSFDYRDFGRELMMCQRYFLVWSNGSGNIGLGGYYNSTYVTTSIGFPVTMRAAPTLTQTTGTNYYGIYSNNTIDYFDSFSSGIQQPTINSAGIDCSTNVSGTSGALGRVVSNAGSFVGFSAEL